MAALPVPSSPRRRRARTLPLLLLLAAALCLLQFWPRTLGGSLSPGFIDVDNEPDPLLVDDTAEIEALFEPAPKQDGIFGRTPMVISVLVYGVCFMVAYTEPPAPTGTPPKLYPDVPPLEKRKDYNAVLFMSALLSLVSGVVNALAIIEMGGTVAHHTGNASHAGRLLGVDGLRFGSLMVAYLGGAGLAGYCKANGEAVFSRRYSPSMLSGAIAVAMGAVIFNVTQNALVALPLLSFSQGLQNAVTRQCGSLPVCTTHMTGYLTDAGFGLGLWARSGGRDPVPLKTKFFLISIGAFVIGGIVAKLLRDMFGIMSGLLPAAVMATVAFGLLPLPKHAVK